MMRFKSWMSSAGDNLRLWLLIISDKVRLYWDGNQKIKASWAFGSQKGKTWNILRADKLEGWIKVRIWKETTRRFYVDFKTYFKYSIWSYFWLKRHTINVVFWFWSVDHSGESSWVCVIKQSRSEAQRTSCTNDSSKYERQCKLVHWIVSATLEIRSDLVHLKSEWYHFWAAIVGRIKAKEEAGQSIVHRTGNSVASILEQWEILYTDNTVGEYKF